MYHFPQITQKNRQKHISLAGTDHWNSKPSTNIQCKENNHSAFFNISENLQESQQKTIFLTSFGPLKASYS